MKTNRITMEVYPLLKILTACIKYISRTTNRTAKFPWEKTMKLKLERSTKAN